MSELLPLDLKRIVEGILMAAEEPTTVEQLLSMFEGEDGPGKQDLLSVIEELMADYEGRGIELKEVASGFRFQICQDVSPWIQRLWHERPIKYSRALLETLALIIYKQPITRAEIEEVRGVAVSTTIIKTLVEREWVRVIGHKDVPGKPALYATTKQLLDYFNIKSLSELPALNELLNLDQIAESMDLQLELPMMHEQPEVIVPNAQMAELAMEGIDE